MPNTIKYKTGNLTGSLQKSNVALGINSQGPTSTTGFYAGAGSPPSGNYFIYKVDVSNPPKLYAPASDTELINFVKNEGATGANTGSAANALSWIATQTNLIAANIEYEGIVTNGLVLNLDAGFVGSYPTTASTWYDLSGNGFNSTLTNGPTFNSANSGSIVFDGVDDYVLTGNILQFSPTDSFTMSVIFYLSSISGDNTTSRATTIFGRGATNGSVGIGATKSTTNAYLFQIGSRSVNNLQTTYSLVLDQIYFVTFIYDGAAQLSATTNQYVYINGVLRGTQNITSGLGGTFDTAGYASFINRAVPGGNGTYSSGGLFYSSVYNRALSEAEVLQNYNAQKGRFGL